MLRSPCGNCFGRDGFAEGFDSVDVAEGNEPEASSVKVHGGKEAVYRRHRNLGHPHLCLLGSPFPSKSVLVLPTLAKVLPGLMKLCFCRVVSENSVTRIYIGNLVIDLAQTCFKVIFVPDGGIQALNVCIDGIDRGVEPGNSGIKAEVGYFDDGVEVGFTLGNQGVDVIDRLVGALECIFVCIDSVRGYLRRQERLLVQGQQSGGI